MQLFYSKDKSTYLFTEKEYPIDESLDKIIALLSPRQFLRISSQYIISIHAIKDIISHNNSRLKIVIQAKSLEPLVVSREKVSAFKEWLQQ
ncbi:MAG: LytTR family transcriptional regulator DNA-binding domain-containing protein [Bacteroidales bacterium]|nr:LytTR family transcriptional regulator DNA-binding domain-containing protein [Bacteroidales bacterium]